MKLGWLAETFVDLAKVVVSPIVEFDDDEQEKPKQEKPKQKAVCDNPPEAK